MPDMRNTPKARALERIYGDEHGAQGVPQFRDAALHLPAWRETDAGDLGAINAIGAPVSPGIRCEANLRARHSVPNFLGQCPDLHAVFIATDVEGMPVNPVTGCGQ